MYVQIAVPVDAMQYPDPANHSARLAYRTCWLSRHRNRQRRAKESSHLENVAR